MLKVTYPMIAKHYNKCLRTIKYKAKKLGSNKDLGSLIKILSFYEKKQTK